MQRNIHWWHVPSSSSTQASQSASTCPTSWLGRPGLQPRPEMPMAAMALKPASYIYRYIERSVEMAKPDMPGCHALFFCLNRIPKWTPELINGVDFHAPLWDSPVTVPQHWHYCLTEAWRTRPLHGPRKAAAIFRSGSTWVITYKELGTANLCYAYLVASSEHVVQELLALPWSFPRQNKLN